MGKLSDKPSYYLVNAVTIYRIVAVPALLLFLFTGQINVFKWLLAVSYSTDLIDGYLARKFKVASILGTKLDSIGDDLTILVSIVALFWLKPGFVREEKTLLIILLGLFALQTVYALIRYGKISSFHTYLAKLAAILQGVFFILAFFMKEPFKPLFFTAAFVTALELVEEILLVYFLKEWKTNVKGLYWALKAERVTPKPER